MLHILQPRAKKKKEESAFKINEVTCVKTWKKNYAKVSKKQFMMAGIKQRRVLGHKPGNASR